MSLLQKDVQFNRLLYLDLMFLEGEAVLHVAASVTLLEASAYMGDSQTTDKVWDLWLEIWVMRYVGFPEEVHVDYGSQMRSDLWRALWSQAKVKMRESGVESHNALGAGERYHVFLRQIFSRVRAAHPGYARSKALSLDTWAMNHTAGISGLSPMLLVFGIHSHIPVQPINLPDQRKRRKAFVEARADMFKLVALARLATASRSPVPRATMADIALEMRVLVYREKTKQ